jgi:hypothetical protein
MSQRPLKMWNSPTRGPDMIFLCYPWTAWKLSTVNIWSGIWAPQKIQRGGGPCECWSPNFPEKTRSSGQANKKNLRQRSQTSWAMVGIVDWFIDPHEPRHILFWFYIWDSTTWTQVVDEAGRTPRWKHLRRTWSQTAQQKTTRLQMICSSTCNLGDFALPHFNCTQREDTIRLYKRCFPCFLCSIKPTEVDLWRFCPEASDSCSSGWISNGPSYSVL